MNVQDKLNKLKIECVRSNQIKYKSTFDFKLRNDKLEKCKFVFNIRILSENQLDVNCVGDIIDDLNKFNNIQRYCILNNENKINNESIQTNMNMFF